MKKKVVAAILVAAMGTSMLAGCGSSSSDSANSGSSAGTTSESGTSGDSSADSTSGDSGAAADGDLLVYGIYKSGDQAWFINEGAAAQARVEELGGTFTYVDAKMNPEEFLKAVDNAIANEADGIVACVPDQTMSQAVVDKCEEAGIPIVAADDALEVNGEKLAPWVGIDGYNIGAANGEWLANYMTENNLVTDPEMGVLIMTMDTVTSCVPRAEGEIDKLTEMLPDLDESKIYRADYDGTTDKGNTCLLYTSESRESWSLWSGILNGALWDAREPSLISRK